LAGSGNSDGMTATRERIGGQTQADRERGETKGKIVEGIDVLESCFDMVPGATKKVGGYLANSIGQVIRSRGFLTRSHVEIAEPDDVVVRVHSLCSDTRGKSECE